MKKLSILMILLSIAFLGQAQKYDSFGKKIKSKGSINASQLVKNEPNTQTVKVEGEVESVCQMAGCWMKIKTEDGKTMRVTFKDYGFFVPKDIAGKKVIFEGVASVKTTSVADLKHYAEDAGKTKEEIAKITEPKTELTFLADGVLVPKN
jgi:wobble nucleotide-excising tRNase